MGKPRLRLAIIGIMAVLAALVPGVTSAMGSGSDADGEDPNRAETRVRVLHVFVKADVNDVRFENIWVIERPDVNSPWSASIEVPEGAELLQVDDPNLTSYIPSSGTVVKPLAADSKVGSLGLSYLLPNDAGACTTTIPLPHRVDSMVLSVSGKNTQVASNKLKFDSFRASRSAFSSVYHAGDLPASTEVMVSLSSLPREDPSLIRSITMVILALIFGLAAVTMLFSWNRGKVD